MARAYKYSLDDLKIAEQDLEAFLRHGKLPDAVLDMGRGRFIRHLYEWWQLDGRKTMHRESHTFANLQFWLKEVFGKSMLIGSLQHKLKGRVSVVRWEAEALLCVLLLHWSFETPHVFLGLDEAVIRHGVGDLCDALFDEYDYLCLSEEPDEIIGGYVPIYQLDSPGHADTSVYFGQAILEGAQMDVPVRDVLGYLQGRLLFTPHSLCGEEVIDSAYRRPQQCCYVTGMVKDGHRLRPVIIFAIAPAS